MFRPKDGHGLGNILMQLCHVTDTVSDKFYTDGNRGKFIKTTLKIVRDDTESDTLQDPPLNINPKTHARIREIISPTEHAKSYIHNYRHLIEGVEFAFQIRRGALSSDKEVAKRSSVHCDDTALLKFFHIIDQTNGNVYISSDCLETKRKFLHKYGERVRFIDETAEYITNDLKNEPWVTFTDFFLLGMCPRVFITGGARDMFTFSTFGYMACMYGNNECIPIFNDAYDSIHIKEINSS